MTTRIRKFVIAAVAVAAAAVVLPGTVASAAVNDSSVPCLHALPGGTSTWDGQSVTTTTATKGKGKKAVTPTTYTLGGTGTFDFQYVLGTSGPAGTPLPAPSCVGVTYSFHIWTSPTFDLHWATGTTSPANPSTLVSPDGHDIVVNLAGDGLTSTIDLQGTTAGVYSGTIKPCVDAEASIISNGTVVATSNTMSVCLPPDSGGGNAW